MEYLNIEIMLLWGDGQRTSHVSCYILLFMFVFYELMDISQMFLYVWSEMTAFLVVVSWIQNENLIAAAWF